MWIVGNHHAAHGRTNHRNFLFDAMENDAVIDGNHGRKIQLKAGASEIGQIGVDFSTQFGLFKNHIDEHIVLRKDIAVGVFVFK